MRSRANPAYLKRILSALVFAGVMVAGLQVLHAVNVTQGLDRVLWEYRFSVSQRPVTGDLVFVDIDARSLEQLGVWPVPRSTYGKLIDRLSEAGAADIVFDIDFSSASSEEEDRQFAKAIERAGNVSLAAFRQSAMGAGATGDGSEVLNQPITQLLEVAWPVVVMVPVEADSRIWRNLYGFELNGTEEVSAAAYLGEHSGAASGAFWLDYSIAIGSLPRVSMIDVLEGGVANTELFGKKVIIGASAQELRDLFPTPVYGILPGAVIQALGAETLLQERALNIQGALPAVLLVLLVFVLLAATSKARLGTKLAVLAVTSAALEGFGVVVLQERPVLLSTAGAQLLILGAATVIIFQELGLRKLLSQIYKAGQRNSVRMLGQVFDDSFDAIVVIDGTGKITASSEVARSLFNLTEASGEKGQDVLPGELVDEAAVVLAAPEGSRPVPKILGLQDDGGERRVIEYVVTRSEKTIAGRTRRQAEQSEALACLTCRDITEQYEATERLSYLARFDPVTGMLNRNGFEEEIGQAPSDTLSEDTVLCLVQFSVSNLDQIIASLGFSYGDLLRKAVARRLEEQTSGEIVWAALTADVFAGAVKITGNDAGAEGLIQEIQQVVGADYRIEGSRISVRLNFGYILDHYSSETADLLKQSGNALARARRNNMHSAVAYRPEMRDVLERRRHLEMELFKAIARNELRMVYQPLIELNNREIIGVEALLRWRHGELGEISPAEFIPIAEENGYIVELGVWIINRAMQEIAALGSGISLSVNVSALQFSRGDIVATVRDALHSSGFTAAHFDMEITESLFIDETIDINSCMDQLRALGCRFSLDDFGTGYSSLGYVQKYPFSKIKLDRMFVRNVVTNSKDVALIEAVLHMAKGFGMDAVIEGVETEDQAKALSGLGCQIAQGFLFGRPMSAGDLALMLRVPA